MSTRRRTNRRFKRRGTRRSNQRTETITKMVPKASSLNRKIKRLNDMIELKFIDSFFSGSVNDNGSSIQLLNGIPIGTDPDERVGLELRATSVQFRGYLLTDPDVLASSTVRIIVFWDRQANGSVPLTLTSLTAADGTILDLTTVTDPTLAPYNYSAIDRYRVLYDKIITINPDVINTSVRDEGPPDVTTTATVLTKRANFKKKIKLGRTVKYDDASSGIASIATNSLYMVAYTMEDDGPVLRFGSRFYYKDA